MPQINNQTKKRTQTRDNVIALRVSDDELEHIRKTAFEAKKNQARLIRDTFFQKYPDENCSDSIA